MPGVLLVSPASSQLIFPRVGLNSTYFIHEFSKCFIKVIRLVVKEVRNKLNNLKTNNLDENRTFVQSRHTNDQYVDEKLPMSSINREMQIKTSRSYHHIPVSRVRIEQTNDNKCW